MVARFASPSPSNISLPSTPVSEFPPLSLSTGSTSNVAPEPNRLAVESLYTPSCGFQESTSLFLSRLAHQVRTPLGVLLATAGILEHDTTCFEGDDKQTYLSYIKEAIARIDLIVEGANRLGMIEALALYPQRPIVELSYYTPSPIELSNAITHAIELASSQEDIRRLIINRGTPSSAMLSQAQAEILTRALVPLFDNALKFSNGNDFVEISTHFGPEKAVRICIVDRGIGIPEDFASYLFQPFRRARNARAYPGEGLGLFLAQRCASLLGGYLKVSSSAEEGGTTVELLFTITEP